VQSIPITVEHSPVAYLYALEVSKRDNLLTFAANILGLELARRQAVLNGRRELLGQIVEDVAQRTASDAQARRRLQSLGVTVDDPFHLVLAATPGSHGEPRRVLWSVGEIGDGDADPLPMAFVNGDLVMFVPPTINAWTAAEKLYGRLQKSHPDVQVGVSQERARISGLRLSYHEARHASRRGRGVNTSEPLSLQGLLMGNLDLPLRELARSVLKPLLDYDAEHHVHLVETLRAYLANNCSAKQTSETLALHRNGLRYRLELIEQLTGRDLAELTQQLELALALTAFDSPSVT
jgi:purine catabolism regulator